MEIAQLPGHYIGKAAQRFPDFYAERKWQNYNCPEGSSCYNPNSLFNRIHSYNVMLARRRQLLRNRKVSIPRRPVRTKRTLFRSYTAPSAGLKETKYVDFVSEALTIQKYNSPPLANTMNILIQGAAPYQRIGSHVNWKSMRIRVAFRPNGTAVQDALRMVVIYDRQTNGVAPTWADVIQDTDQSGATGTYNLSGLNMNNRERFLCLADSTIVVPSIGTWTPPGTGLGIPDATRSLLIDRYIKLRDLTSHYKATAGTVGDISTGGLFLFFACGQNNANTWLADIHARLRFSDV